MNWILFAMGPSGSEGGSPAGLLIPLLGMLVIFYFLLIRPQQRKQRELQQMISALRKGDRILTTGGIYGTVLSVKEHIIVLKIAENVKIEMVKSAVASVVERGNEG
ncbi:MAG: preprotein translocase subunit YajC [Candidatus Latescibacteria bacterium]|nr:preprotein translocase subunit YajC [Candidatus Latescibacterota bacterium]NIM66504.1 preprotein translocase subunit YajC [Candidatus Latescibacterota bacterium]NIO02984.1 preprotein translocase subunit YajC [Candidatus Latescibacterota bacterium]NIO30119.1 preprotein translocase subunit YajC [Candidatus Latescibacterota bacterium]NIO57738.1 preprotein translocase subunit YajC [Candidatus Latescibacterota bacterium]